ncbi:MAG: hypothetical protein FWD55_08860 [Propionibacteriaceae bacterium]|nr:hypothetical protein [Propionibacteriaceae bacterium]
MRATKRALLTAAIALAGFSACSTPPPILPEGTPYEPPLVEVVVRDLMPTVSMDASVVVSPEFSILAPSTGVVSAFAKIGSSVKAGQKIAAINGTSVVSPVDGVVVGPLVDSGEIVPQNLPIIAIRYSGFALEGAPNRWMQATLFEAEIHGRGQLTYGSEPFDCAALVPSMSTEVIIPTDKADLDYLEVPVYTDDLRWICLVPKVVTVNTGGTGVVVVTSTVAKSVVAVPVNAVSGRISSGQVMLLTHQGLHLVDVKLGATDGSYIEILEGLSAGDLISSMAPDLVAKRPR